MSTNGFSTYSEVVFFRLKTVPLNDAQTLNEFNMSAPTARNRDFFRRRIFIEFLHFLNFNQEKSFSSLLRNSQVVSEHAWIGT